MLRCKTSFFAARDDRGERYVALGQDVADDDPVVKGREALFEPVDPEPAAKPRKAKKRA